MPSTIKLRSNTTRRKANKTEKTIPKNRLFLVRETGLEPVRAAPHAPQTCASADSATLAYSLHPLERLYTIPFSLVHVKRFLENFFTFLIHILGRGENVVFYLQNGGIKPAVLAVFSAYQKHKIFAFNPLIFAFRCAIIPQIKTTEVKCDVCYGDVSDSN